MSLVSGNLPVATGTRNVTDSGVPVASLVTTAGGTITGELYVDGEATSVYVLPAGQVGCENNDTGGSYDCSCDGTRGYGFFAHASGPSEVTLKALDLAAGAGESQLKMIGANDTILEITHGGDGSSESDQVLIAVYKSLTEGSRYLRISLPAYSAISGQNTLTVPATSGTLLVVPSSIPSVTGSRGGNAALASLLTALAGMGVIQNNTTA